MQSVSLNILFRYSHTLGRWIVEYKSISEHIYNALNGCQDFPLVFPPDIPPGIFSRIFPLGHVPHAIPPQSFPPLNLSGFCCDSSLFGAILCFFAGLVYTVKTILFGLQHSQPTLILGFKEFKNLSRPHYQKSNSWQRVHL